MRIRTSRLLGLALLAALVFAPVHAAHATLTLPGGDTLLNGAFDDLGYGATGNAYVTPYLYVGDLASTDSPSAQAAVTLLTYGYAIAGLGTANAKITYSFTNDDVSPFSDLRFIANIQPDGSGSFNDMVSEVWGAPVAGDPDERQLADFFDDLNVQIATNDGLDGSDTCGGSCDADVALQWNLASLGAGATWQIVLSLADDGSAISGRRLVVTSVDTTGTQLTLSGTAMLVPEPSLVVLSGLAGLALARRRRP